MFLLLSTNHNFLFIHVPKTGGNSIQRVLLPFSDDRMVADRPHHDGINRFEIVSDTLGLRKHATLEDYRKRLHPDVFRRLTKIACVRNPWDRCASFFFSPHRGSVSWSPEIFEDFIRTEVHPHSRYLALTPDQQAGSPFDHVDVVLRFERLAEDFSSLCERLEIGRTKLPRINVSQREDYRSYFTTSRLIDLVADRFAPEIARFNYDF